MNESDLQKSYNYPIYPRDSKIYSDKGFVNIDNGAQGGTHWTCFIVKDNKSCYFDSFGGQPDKIQLNQLPKPIIYHFYKTQDMYSKICGSYCLYFFIYWKECIILILFQKCILKNAFLDINLSFYLCKYKYHYNNIHICIVVFISI